MCTDLISVFDHIHLIYKRKLSLHFIQLLIVRARNTHTHTHTHTHALSIFLIVNKMVAIVGDIWRHVTSLVAATQLAIRILALLCVLISIWNTSGWSWVLCPIGQTVRRCGVIIDILGKLWATGLRASFLRKRFGCWLAMSAGDRGSKESWQPLNLFLCLFLFAFFCAPVKNTCKVRHSHCPIQF